MKYIIALWHRLVKFFIREKIILVPIMFSEKKVDFNIERFERAIFQCQNPDKLPELKKNLAYWQSLKNVYHEYRNK